MHRFIIWLARVTAILGGFVLMVLVAMTTLSIIGRTLSKMLHSDFAVSSFGSLSQWIIDLGVGEINGNYELLEAGVAFAIFSFFPICQLYNEHATVDVFTSGMSPKALRILRAFWEVVLSLTIIFITWRLYEGMQRYVGNGGNNAVSTDATVVVLCGQFHCCFRCLYHCSLLRNHACGRGDNRPRNSS